MINNKDIVKIMVEQDIIHCVKIYGIEGLETKIKELWKHNQKARELYLNCLYNLYNFGGKRNEN